MKTTYYLKENAVGEFLLVVEDDGVVKFVGHFPHDYGVGDLLSDLMDGASGQWIDDNNFGNDIEDFSELSENWADCAVIADNDGVYVDHAGKDGNSRSECFGAKIAEDTRGTAARTARKSGKSLKKESPVSGALFLNCAGGIRKFVEGGEVLGGEVGG